MKSSKVIQVGFEGYVSIGAGVELKLNASSIEFLRS